MNRFLKYLDSLNRKERFFLYTYATGNPYFTLSSAFREHLGAVVDVVIPRDARAYIDYHLDWLHAAAHLSRGVHGGPVWPNCDDAVGALSPGGVDSFGVSTGTQEDIDLLVAFEDAQATWVILVEAKAETGWTNRQLASKARRLGVILGKGSDSTAGAIRPRFCLLSPRKPTQLRTDEWPEWMLKPGPTGREVRWLRLPVASGRKQLIGCNQAGTPSHARRFWTVIDVKAASDALVE